MVSLFIPLILVLILDGVKCVRETWSVVVLIGVLFSGTQSWVLLLLGPELGGGEAAPAIWMWTPFNVTGTAILCAVIVCFLLARTFTPRDLFRTLRAAVSDSWRPILMILLIMAVASIADYSGGSATIGLALATVRVLFRLLSPVMGWFGVFITGIVVNNNNLFTQLQVMTAQQIELDPTLLVAANIAGGVMAKVVSPQSIVITAAAADPRATCFSCILGPCHSPRVNSPSSERVLSALPSPMRP